MNYAILVVVFFTPALKRVMLQAPSFLMALCSRTRTPLLGVTSSPPLTITLTMKTLPLRESMALIATTTNLCTPPLRKRHIPRPPLVPAQHLAVAQV
jgi:hypothetical protein